MQFSGWSRQVHAQVWVIVALFLGPCVAFRALCVVGVVVGLVFEQLDFSSCPPNFYNERVSCAGRVVGWRVALCLVFHSPSMRKLWTDKSSDVAMSRPTGLGCDEQACFFCACVCSYKVESAYFRYRQKVFNQKWKQKTGIAFSRSANPNTNRRKILELGRLKYVVWQTRRTLCYHLLVL